jgi:PAS domain S-box-containing protein
MVGMEKEQKRMDRTLHENESHLAGIINSAMDAIITMGEDQRIRLFNPAAEKMFQRPASEVLGKELTMLIPERLRAKHEGDVHSFGKTSVTKRSMGRLGMIYGLRANGEEFPLEVSISQNEFEGQKTFTAILRDITERKRAEAQLRESEERFRAMADSAPVLIWISGTDKLFTWFNRGWLDFVGRSMEQEIGNGWAENIYPQDRDRCLKAYRKAFDARQPFKMEYRLRRYDGEWRWVLDSGVPRSGPDQEFSGYIGSCIDITERKQAEVETQRMMLDLKRSNQELEQFAYVASHDLQEPLRMVSSYVQLIARRYRGKLDQDADEFIDYAVDGVNRMKVLINDLLAFSRVGTRGKKLSPVALDAVVEIAISNLQLTIEEDNALVTHDPLPQVLADEGQMIQLFQNLIGNAIKFRSEEPPKVHIGVRREKDEWQFFVRDNGIGIEPQFAERIFVIFQRLHTREEYPGTGIGLSICRKIVERHGGRIWVESEPGHGTTFYFTLPVMEQHE